VFDWASGIAIDPTGLFAPPVQRGIAAVTGLRLYASVSPDAYHPVSAEISFPGGYLARAVATPGRITLEANGKEQTCDTNFGDPTDKAAREQSDCFVAITDVPAGGRELATISVEWSVAVTSNIPGIENDEFTVEPGTDLDIEIKELQAVAKR
jgi:hypothetical protein